MRFDTYLRAVVLIAVFAGAAWHLHQIHRGRVRTAAGDILRSREPREFAIEAVQFALMLLIALAAAVAGGRYFAALLPFLIAWTFAATTLRSLRTGEALALGGTIVRAENRKAYRRAIALTATLALLSAAHALHGLIKG
jgi:hypothetical protein